SEAERAQVRDQVEQPVERGAVVGRREADEHVDLGGAAQVVDVVARHHAALRPAHQIDLAGVSGRENVADLGRELAGRRGYLAGRVNPGQREGLTVIE